jgi:hypothetical protein
MNLFSSIRRIVPQPPRHDPGTLLGLPAWRVPAFDYGTAARLVTPGAVIYRDGDWRIVARHTDPTRSPLLVTDTAGEQLTPIHHDTLVVTAVAPATMHRTRREVRP